MANPNEFSQPASYLNGGPFETTWGPYATKEAACLALKNEVDADGKNRRMGKIVGIGTVEDNKEHRWIGGFEDKHLVPVLGDMDAMSEVLDPEIDDNVVEFLDDQGNVGAKLEADGTFKAGAFETSGDIKGREGYFSNVKSAGQNVVKEQDIAEIKENVIPSADSDLVQFIDDNKQVGARLDEKGQWAAGELLSSKGKLFLNLDLIESDDTIEGIVFHDEQGFVAFEITDEGVKIDPTEQPKQPILKYEINLVPSYGQSLSLGWTSNPPISVSQKYNALMFRGGIRADEYADQANAFNAFVPAVEALSPDSARGETPESGFSENVAELILKENKVDILAQSYQFLLSAPGIGGASIAQLSKGYVGSGAGGYAKLAKTITEGYAVANQLGKTFSFPCYLWTQGEGDNAGSTTFEQYKTRMLQLLSDINQDTKAVTKQSEDVQCILYQTTTANQWDRFDRTEIAKAQLSLALTDQRFTMATPLYPFQFSGDNKHLTASGSKKLGAHYGLAFKRVFMDGERWLPIHPVSHICQNTIVEILFYVPVAPLVIDTSLITDPGNFGFRVFNSLNVEVSIISVEVIRGTSVKVRTAGDITGGRLTYAVNGYTNTFFSRGNLRDSQGDYITFDKPGLNYKMYNWAPIFEITL